MHVGDRVSSKCMWGIEGPLNACGARSQLLVSFPFNKSIQY